MSDFISYVNIQNSNIRQIYYNLLRTPHYLWFTNYGNNTIQYTSDGTSINTITDISGSIAIATNPNGLNAYTAAYSLPNTIGTISITNPDSGVTTRLTTSGAMVAYNNLVYDNDNNLLWGINATTIYKIIITTSTAVSSSWYIAPANIYSLTVDYDNNFLYVICPANNCIYKLGQNDETSSLLQTINLTSYDLTTIQPVLSYIDNKLYFTYTDTDIYVTFFDVTDSGTTFTLSGNILTCPTTSVSLYSMTVDESFYVYIVVVDESEEYIIYKSSSAFCFNEGTKILCMNKQMMDKYIRIELLRIGDFVKTYKHGYRKIHKIIKGSFKNNPKKWNMCMYKMAKTRTNGLTDDLIVTGGHSLLVDAISDEEQKKYDEMGISEFSKTTIDNKHLLLSCCSDQFAPMQDNKKYNYYHLLLENNDDEEERFGIWANGILTETPNVKTVK